MALLSSFLSNLHQTERECQRTPDAATPTPISDPAKISALKSSSQISKPNKENLRNDTYCSFFATENGKEDEISSHIRHYNPSLPELYRTIQLARII